jgi:hypothetical protein
MTRSVSRTEKQDASYLFLAVSASSNVARDNGCVRRIEFTCRRSNQFFSPLDFRIRILFRHKNTNGGKYIPPFLFVRISLAERSCLAQDVGKSGQKILITTRDG